MLTGLLLAGCGLGPMRGINVLEHARVGLGSPDAERSLAHLAALGADTVVFVPFLRQGAADGCELAPPDAAGLARLRAALAQARALGLARALKPQVLPEGTWHGRIAARDEATWSCWFAAYRAALAPLARLAAEQHAAIFVAGTELKGTERRHEWRELIAGLRAEFSGEIGYVFHDTADADAFSAADLLDSYGFTLYPPLGEAPEPAALAVPIGAAAQRLRQWAGTQDKPVWIAEIGIASRAGAQARPWEWEEQAPLPRRPDPALQETVIGLWLDALEGRWHRGVWLWNWLSDPDAGGPLDTDFTLQGKPAERMLACRWAGRCGHESTH